MIKSSSHPDWVEYLMNVGRLLTAHAEDKSLKKWTVALCLPHINYAAVFCAVGVQGWHVANHTAAQGLERLRPLIGGEIIYKFGGKRKTGKLIGIDEEKKCIKILVSRVRRETNFSEMTLEQRKRYKPPAVTASHDLLQMSDWESIEPTGRNYKKGGVLGGDAQSSCALKSGFDMVEAVFPGGGNLLLSSSEIFSCIEGNNRRLREELECPIGWPGTGTSVSLKHVLRPDNIPHYQNSSHLKIFRLRNTLPQQLCKNAIYLIEAGNGLADLLQMTQEHHRIVLFPRNAHFYPEACQTLSQLFYIRRGDAPSDFIPESPPQIHALAFQHA